MCVCVVLVLPGLAISGAGSAFGAVKAIDWRSRPVHSSLSVPEYDSEARSFLGSFVPGRHKKRVYGVP